MDQVPKLSDFNGWFCKIILPKVLPGLYDGMGGLNYSTIAIVLDEEQIEPGQYRSTLFDKVLTVATIINENREAKKKK